MAKKRQKKGDQNDKTAETKRLIIAEATTIRISQQLQKFHESKDEGVNNAWILLLNFLIPF